MSKLSIPVARYGPTDGVHRDVVPCDMTEVMKTRVKNKSYTLRCPDGHDLVFRKRSSDGRRAHFAHRHSVQSRDCCYLKKYKGGESKDHLTAKMWFGRQMEIRFITKCMHKCNDVLLCITRPDWTYETEKKMTLDDGSPIWVDGAFCDPDGNVTCVVEVKHTHGTAGKKRTWLQNQSFTYVEVAASHVLTNPDPVQVIDHGDGDIRCDHCGEYERKQQIRAWKQWLRCRSACEHCEGSGKYYDYWCDGIGQWEDCPECSFASYMTYHSTPEKRRAWRKRKEEEAERERERRTAHLTEKYGANWKRLVAW